MRRASEIEPAFPLAHSALSQALGDLGYDAQSLDEAKLAFEKSGTLPREERLAVEARYREAARQWPDWRCSSCWRR